MSGIANPADAVKTAQQLLELVTSIAALPAPGILGQNKLVEDSLAAWHGRAQVQTLCDRLLMQTMGVLEYTVVLSGGSGRICQMFDDQTERQIRLVQNRVRRARPSTLRLHWALQISLQMEKSR